MTFAHGFVVGVVATVLVTLGLAVLAVRAAVRDAMQTPPRHHWITYDRERHAMYKTSEN